MSNKIVVVIVMTLVIALLVATSSVFATIDDFAASTVKNNQAQTPSEQEPEVSEPDAEETPTTGYPADTSSLARANSFVGKVGTFDGVAVEDVNSGTMISPQYSGVVTCFDNNIIVINTAKTGWVSEVIGNVGYWGEVDFYVRELNMDGTWSDITRRADEIFDVYISDQDGLVWSTGDYGAPSWHESGIRIAPKSGVRFYGGETYLFYALGLGDLS